MPKVRAVVAALFVSALAAASATAGERSRISAGPAWDGLYVGGHAGWAWSGIDWTYLTEPRDLGGPLGSTASHGFDGWLAGAQIGYQRRFDRWVAGVELTYSGGDFFSSRTSLPFGPDDVEWIDLDESVSTELGGLFTVAGRVGFVVDPRFLIYAKAGYATADVRVRTFNEVVGLGGSATARANTSERHGGWIAGAGVEHALAPNLTLGLDYTYIDLGAERHSTMSLASDETRYPYDLRVKPDPIHAVSLRLNFQLGGPRLQSPEVK